MHECLDRPPAGWFALDVMKTGSARKWDWVSIWFDVPPDGHCSGERPARQSCWVRIPGKHRNHDAAWNALEDMIATRH
jgi:hypothetical protein